MARVGRAISSPLRQKNKAPSAGERDDALLVPQYDLLTGYCVFPN